LKKALILLVFFLLKKDPNLKKHTIFYLNLPRVQQPEKLYLVKDSLGLGHGVSLAKIFMTTQC